MRQNEENFRILCKKTSFLGLISLPLPHLKSPWLRVAAVVCCTTTPVSFPIWLNVLATAPLTLTLRKEKVLTLDSCSSNESLEILWNAFTILYGVAHLVFCGDDEGDVGLGPSLFELCDDEECFIDSFLNSGGLKTGTACLDGTGLLVLLFILCLVAFSRVLESSCAQLLQYY